MLKSKVATHILIEFVILAVIAGFFLGSYGIFKSGGTDFETYHGPLN